MDRWFGVCDQRKYASKFFFPNMLSIYIYLSIYLLSMYDCIHVYGSSHWDKVMIMISDNNDVTPVWFLRQSNNGNECSPCWISLDREITTTVTALHTFV